MTERSSVSPAPKRSGSRLGCLVFVGLLVLVGLVLLGALPRLKHDKDLHDEARATVAHEPQVGVIKPVPSPRAELLLPGTTEAIEDAVIAARSSGYLSKRLVDIGDHVHAGQLLAVIESPDVDQQLYQARAQQSQSRAQTEQAKADLANKTATVAQFRSNVRQAQANVEQTSAMLIDAQAKLAELKAAEATAEAQEAVAQHGIGVKQAALIQAQTQRDLADVTYKRYKTLLDAGYVALQDADMAEAAYKTAVAAVNSAQSDLSAAQATDRAAIQGVHGAQANVHSGEAEVTAAERNVGAIKQTVSANESTVAAAKANVHLGESNVAANLDAERANQYNTKRFAILTSFENVVAPFPGVITARNVEVGTLVSSGEGGGTSQPITSSGGSSVGSAANAGSASTASAAPSTTPGGGLFGLARTDVLRILVSVPQSFANEMHVGLQTGILIREYPGRIFKGTVARMAGALDVNSRTLLTEVHLDNRSGAVLPGVFTQMQFDLPNRKGEFRLPSSALISDALGTRVAVVGTDNKVRFVPVKVDRDYGQQLDIREGLKGDENVVVAPTDDLTEGEAVKPNLVPPLPIAPSQPGSPVQPAAHGQGSPASSSSSQSAAPGLGGPGNAGQSNPTIQQGTPSEPGSAPHTSGSPAPQSRANSQSPSSPAPSGQSQPSTKPRSGGASGGTILMPGNGATGTGYGGTAGGGGASGGSSGASGGTAGGSSGTGK